MSSRILFSPNFQMNSKQCLQMPKKIESFSVKDKWTLELCTLFAKVIGLCPYEVNIAKPGLYSKFYIFLFHGALIIILVLTEIFKIQYFFKYYTIIEQMLSISQGITLCSFQVYMLVNNMRCSNSWHSLFKCLDLFDATVENKIKFEKEKTWGILKLILMTIVPFCLLTLNILLWAIIFSHSSPEFTITLCYIPENIGIVYKYNVGAFVLEVASIFCSRYFYLRKYLTHILTNIKYDRHNIDGISARFHQYCDDLQYIKHLVKILHDAVIEFNRLFGILIVFLIVYAQVTILTNFYWSAFIGSKFGFFLILEGIFIYPGLCTVSFNTY